MAYAGIYRWAYSGLVHFISPVYSVYRMGVPSGRGYTLAWCTGFTCACCVAVFEDLRVRPGASRTVLRRSRRTSTSGTQLSRSAETGDLSALLRRTMSVLTPRRRRCYESTEARASSFCSTRRHAAYNGPPHSLAGFKGPHGREEKGVAVEGLE